MNELINFAVHILYSKKITAKFSFQRGLRSFETIPAYFFLQLPKIAGSDKLTGHVEVIDLMGFVGSGVDMGWNAPNAAAKRRRGRDAGSFRAVGEQAMATADAGDDKTKGSKGNNNSDGKRKGPL
jgi:hypothetical protein